ncbi:hypothetical protein WA158_001011 [Blastocystis sp. Blastoise]
MDPTEIPQSLDLSQIQDNNEPDLPGFPATNSPVELSNHYISIDTKDVELPEEFLKDTPISVEVPVVEIVKKDESKNAKLIPVYTVYVVKGQNKWELKYPFTKFLEFEQNILNYSKGNSIPSLSGFVNPAGVAPRRGKAAEETPDVLEGRKLPLQMWLSAVLQIMNIEDYFILDDFFQYTEHSLLYASELNNMDIIMSVINKFSKLYGGYTYGTKHIVTNSTSKNSSTPMSPIPITIIPVSQQLETLLATLQDLNKKGNTIINMLYEEQANEQQKMASIADEHHEVQKSIAAQNEEIEARIDEIKHEIEGLGNDIISVQKNIEKLIMNQTSLRCSSFSFSLTARYYKLLYEQLHTTLSVYRDVQDHTFPRGRKGDNEGETETNKEDVKEYREGEFVGSEMFLEEVKLKFYQDKVNEIVHILQGQDTLAHPEVTTQQATTTLQQYIEDPPTFEDIPPLLQTITQDLLKDNAQFRLDLNAAGVRHPISLYNFFTKPSKPKEEENVSNSSTSRPTLSESMAHPDQYKASDIPLYGLKPLPKEEEQDDNNNNNNTSSSPTTPSSSLFSFLNKPTPTHNNFEINNEEEEEEENVHYGNPFDIIPKKKEVPISTDTITSTSPKDNQGETRQESKSLNPFDFNEINEETTEPEKTSTPNPFDDLVPLTNNAVPSEETKSSSNPFGSFEQSIAATMPTTSSRVSANPMKPFNPLTSSQSKKDESKTEKNVPAVFGKFFNKKFTSNEKSTSTQSNNSPFTAPAPTKSIFPSNSPKPTSTNPFDF